MAQESSYYDIVRRSEMKESKSLQGTIRNRNVSIAERRALNDSVRCRD